MHDRNSVAIEMQEILAKLFGLFYVFLHGTSCDERRPLYQGGEILVQYFYAIFLEVTLFGNKVCCVTRNLL